MNFPKLQMLSEARKKKPVDDEMDFAAGEVETVDAPKAMGKKEILAALSKCTPKDRSDIHDKLMAMVEKDQQKSKK